MRRPPRGLPTPKAKTTLPLTPQEKAFVDAYEGGDPYDAAVQAGYTGNEYAIAAQAERLLNKPNVKRALRAKAGFTPNVLDELDLQETLSRIVQNGGEKTADRIGAAKLLMQNKGMLVDRVKHEGGDLNALILASFQPKPKDNG